MPFIFIILLYIFELPFDLPKQNVLVLFQPFQVYRQNNHAVLDRKLLELFYVLKLDLELEQLIITTAYMGGLDY